MYEVVESNKIVAITLLSKADNQCEIQNCPSEAQSTVTYNHVAEYMV